MKFIKSKRYSWPAIIFIFAFILSASFYFNLWSKNRITIDAPSYYAYLPAFLIHHDLHLNFVDESPAYYQDKIWFNKIEGYKRLIKHPMGVSILLSPFFIAADWITSLSGETRTGYSMLYQNALSVGVL